MLQPWMTTVGRWLLLERLLLADMATMMMPALAMVLELVLMRMRMLVRVLVWKIWRCARS